VASRLALRRAPHCVDYPGFGTRPASRTVTSLDTLTRLLASEAPQRFDLVALSMGAAVALRLALGYPERVRKLVLVTVAAGIDVVKLGGVDVRPSIRRARPRDPMLFVEDTVDFGDRLGAILAPTLLVFGDRDPVSPVAVGEYLLGRLPDARLEIVPGGTHDVESEFPDLIASLIEAHLRR
jgi:pimeloyl-ACP methyl ester carboxylesterase